MAWNSSARKTTVSYRWQLPFGGLWFGSISKIRRNLWNSFLLLCRNGRKHAGCKISNLSRRQEYELECNWKVYVDNYLDGGYHVNTVHPGLAGVLDYSEYRTQVHGNTSVQTSPIKVAMDADPTATKTRTGPEAAYWWVFPNFMMNLYEGVMDTNLVLPLGPGRCKVIFDFYFADTQSLAARQYILDSIAVAHQVQEEDMGICEQVQRGLASSSFSTGRFSVKREIAGYHFHQLLARELQNRNQEPD